MDYLEQAIEYEKTRNVEEKVYWILSKIINPQKNDVILDFGCGTGNYLQRFYDDYQIPLYGLEKSYKMAEIARNKNLNFNIQIGDHTMIPFPVNFFSKIYCTDVIHQIENIDVLFKNLYNIAQNNAIFVICTESSEQLNEKYWNRYFPSIFSVDSKRFYSMEVLKKQAAENNWTYCKTFKIEEETTAPITERFIKKVRKRTLSVLHEISNQEYDDGLRKITHDYMEQKEIHQVEGYTLMVFMKNESL